MTLNRFFPIKTASNWENKEKSSLYCREFKIKFQEKISKIYLMQSSS